LRFASKSVPPAVINYCQIFICVFISERLSMTAAVQKELNQCHISLTHSLRLSRQDFPQFARFLLSLVRLAWSPPPPRIQVRPYVSRRGAVIAKFIIAILAAVANAAHCIKCMYSCRCAEHTRALIYFRRHLFFARTAQVTLLLLQI
jgi:hypothetical protein